MRQGVPGPCLGFQKLKKALRRKTNTFDSVEETDEDDDKPDQDDNEVHFVLDGELLLEPFGPVLFLVILFFLIN